MNKIQKMAVKWLEKGFSVIPVNHLTKKSHLKWQKFQTEAMRVDQVEYLFDDVKATGIAVVCGGKWRVFCLDIDCKYDLTGRLYEDLKKKIPNEILKKMYCQKTQNGGYHFIFLAPSSRLIGSKGIAYRHTTAFEKDITYRALFDDPKTRETALTTALGDNVRVLIESRSGTPEKGAGYFLTPPSPGYQYIYGKINEITEEEFDTIMDCARSFNEVRSDVTPLKDSDFKGLWEVTPFDDYNKNGDALGLLYEHGWTFVEQRGKDVRLKRPGQTFNDDSAYFDTESNNFYPFTTSTLFEANKNHPPATVYAILKHKGNTQEAYKNLANEGWGVKLESK